MLDALLFPTIDNGAAQQRAEWIVEAQRPVSIVRAEDPTQIPSSYTGIVWDALGVYGSSDSTEATPHVIRREFLPSESSATVSTVHPSIRQ